MEKKCNKCGEVKMLTEFVKHKSYKDGHYSRCKVCTRALEKEWRQNNQEKKRAARTRYREKNREKIREMDREYYVKNHEKRLETARKAQMKYYKTEKGKAKYQAQDKLVRERTPEKCRARELLRNALRRKELTKPDSCMICTSTQFEIEAHHPDYSKPLEVIWVCRPCHGIVHRKIKSDRERLSEKTSHCEDATVCSSEETTRGRVEEPTPPS
jgi:hypothetical protein